MVQDEPNGEIVASSGGVREQKLNVFQRIILFIRQVFAELRKVVTPTRQELLKFTAVVLAFVVMTDAIGVRRETGRQGSAINLLMDWFESENEGEEEGKDLKERVGHTPLEVLVGAIWGIVCALLMQ